MKHLTLVCKRRPERNVQLATTKGTGVPWYYCTWEGGKVPCL